MTIELATAFEGHSIRVLRWKERFVWIASEVARAMGYANPSKLSEKIAGSWAEDFIEGSDFEVLTGEALDTFKKGVPESGTAPRGRLPESGGRLLVLFESGLHMALLKARVAKSVALRRFLVTEVLPKLARGEGIPAAKQRPTFTDQEQLFGGYTALRVVIEKQTLQQLEAAGRHSGQKPTDVARWLLRSWSCARWAEYGLSDRPDFMDELRELGERRRADATAALGGAAHEKPFRKR